MFLYFDFWYSRYYIDGSWSELTICILGKIPLYAFTTMLPIGLVIELTLTNIIAQYDQNLKLQKKNIWSLLMKIIFKLLFLK